MNMRFRTNLITLRYLDSLRLGNSKNIRLSQFISTQQIAVYVETGKVIIPTETITLPKPHDKQMEETTLFANSNINKPLRRKETLVKR